MPQKRVEYFCSSGVLAEIEVPAKVGLKEEKR